ncbi:MAG: hypothetical protein AABY09_04285, partial [Nanoarchaeota archaeon]
KSDILKLDLDLPHAFLSATGHQYNFLEEIVKVKDYVGSVSVTQNHGGFFAIDRNWNSSEPMGKQDVDPHFPPYGNVKLMKTYGRAEIREENLAFNDVLIGAVQY